MSKDNHENKGFEESMSKAIPKGMNKTGKVVPAQDYIEAKKGVEDANKDTPDPKGRKFNFIAGRGKIMLYAPKPEIKTDIQLGEKAIAQLAQDKKESDTFRIYAVGPGEEDYVIGDMVHLTSEDGWISVKIDGYIMKIVENYQIQGRIKREIEKKL